VSPVFRHGRLRLYLLKLLDEAPRHGYEVIRLLQDRFLGVYAPSPGTIYPRLARLEEEGLVTHDEVDGKKVYRITEKGREEIRARLDDLAELEEEITESVRDIAREVTEDVRDTVRSLREELTWAARDIRRQSREQARDEAAERARRARDEVRESARRVRDEARLASQGEVGPGDQAGQGEAGQGDQAGQGEAGPGDQARQGRQAPRGDRAGSSGQPRQGGKRGQDRAERPGGWDWTDWAAFQDWAGLRDRPRGQQRAGAGGWPGWAGPPLPGREGPFRPPRPDLGMFRELERLAIDFARELRSAAWHTGQVGEDSLGDLREILEDTLSRIRDEVFGGGARGAERRTPPGPAAKPQQPGGPDEPDSPGERDEPGGPATP
jgi:DNA-binding PadR family transcriptional regulator